MERLKLVGKVSPKSSLQITNSKIGLGFEKLDRGAFDPEKAYDKVAAVGAKWIRIQSGWARTETKKGVYDFKWLDDVVDNLISRGLKPWICLCYGNGLYNEQAAQVYGAVGIPPIYSDEEKEAWSAYVKEICSHFKGRVSHYEIWNEPDGKWCWKNGPDGTEYGLFAVETAKAIKRGNPNAKIIGGAICLRDMYFTNAAMKAGMANYIDALSFHEYTWDEAMVFDRVDCFRGICNAYNPNIKIIQGESGSQSKYGGAGALSGGSWTPRKQAKQLLRHTVADLLCDVEFSSYFSTLDMVEGLNGTIDNVDSYLDYAYFGILGADFDKEGHSTGDYTEKPSYYCLQNLCSIFAEDYTVEKLPIIIHKRPSELNFDFDCYDSTIIKGGFKRKNGSCAFAYWNSLDLMTTEYESTVTIEVVALTNDIKLIDTFDGMVYDIPSSMITDNGNGAYVLNNIPIKDYPLILTFGKF